MDDNPIKKPCLLPGCASTFATISSRNKHIRIYHKEITVPKPQNGRGGARVAKSSSAIKTGQKPINPLNFSCTQPNCSKAYTRKAELLAHLLQVHQVEFVSRDTLEDETMQKQTSPDELDNEKTEELEEPNSLAAHQPALGIYLFRLIFMNHFAFL